MEPREITVQQLHEMIREKQELHLLDVREWVEHQDGYITKSLNIPLEALPSHHKKLPRQTPVVVYCHHGSQSMLAIEYLSNTHGFSNLYLLRGGLHAWATEIDQAVRWY